MRITSYQFSVGGLKLSQNEMTAIGLERLQQARENANAKALEAKGKAKAAFVIGLVSAAVGGLIGYAVKESILNENHTDAAWVGMSTAASILILSASQFFSQRAKHRESRDNMSNFDKAIVSITRNPADAQCPDTVGTLALHGVLRKNTLRPI